MNSNFLFTFTNIEKNFREVLENGYRVMRCCDYISYKTGRQKNIPKILVNRVDIDISPKKARKIAGMFGNLGIKATFFVRLHAQEYNPFAFEEYKCLKYIRDAGHEIGYHSEVVDQSSIWGEEAEFCLKRDLSILSQMLGVEIKGVASHGGMTGLNNLDFWREKRPSDFGLLYEAYDQQPEFGLFHESFYISDSNWTSWKCYDRGALVLGDTRSLGEHSRAEHPVIYSLIHPETYYHEHFYE